MLLISFPHVLDPLQSFLQYCQLQGLSKRTLTALRSALRIFLRSYSDPFKVSDQEALAFFAQGRSKGFGTDRPSGPSNYNNIRKYLKKFYAWAVDFGYTAENPILKVPACRLPKRLPRRLSDEQTAKVLFHAQQYPHPSRYLRARNYAMIAGLLWTGLRAQELLDLRLEDVSFERQCVRVRQGKGNKERLVFFNRELLYVLKDYFGERQRLKKESLFFFVSYGSCLQLDYKNLREVIRRVAQQADIHFTAHQLRHTCFSILAERGVDLVTIQAQAGHTSIATTQRYLHVTDKHRQSTLNKITFL